MNILDIFTALFTSVHLCIETLLKDETIKNTVFGGVSDLYQVLIAFLLIALLMSALLRPVHMAGGLIGSVGGFFGSIERANRRIDAAERQRALAKRPIYYYEVVKDKPKED